MNLSGMPSSEGHPANPSNERPIEMQKCRVIAITTAFRAQCPFDPMINQRTSINNEKKTRGIVMTFYVPLFVDSGGTASFVRVLGR